MIVGTLWNLLDDGPIHSDSGQATAVLMDRLIASGWTVPGSDGKDPKGKGATAIQRTGTFTHCYTLPMAKAGLLARTTRGKRTFDISCAVPAELLVEAGYDRAYAGRNLEVVADAARYDDEPTPTTEAEPEAPPLVVREHEQQLSLDDQYEDLLAEVKVNEVAMRPAAMLVEAVRLISSAVEALPSLALAGIDHEMAGRLADTLAENQRLRRKASEATSEVAALRAERDGLRRMKQMLEINLDKMAKGTFDEQSYRRYVDVKRMMEQPPGSAKAVG